MMHFLARLEDGTEVVCSDIEMINGKEHLRIYFEKPIHLGFHSVWFILPECTWLDNQGFTDAELGAFGEYLTHRTNGSAMG